MARNIEIVCDVSPRLRWPSPPTRALRLLLPVCIAQIADLKALRVAASGEVPVVGRGFQSMAQRSSGLCWFWCKVYLDNAIG